MKFELVKGNTFCIDTGMSSIPFYKVNEKEIIMLDTGWAQGERAGLDKLLEENNLSISAIICTHAHIDHIGNVQYFKEKYNCIAAMPAYEAYICSSNQNLKVYYSNLTLKDVTEHFGHMVCSTDITILRDQDALCINGTEFKIIHTPGHSPAHIGIITPDNVAYLGDSLINEEVMESSKLPYAFILKEDLASKKKLHSLTCDKYIISHKGIYDDITKLIEINIDFYKGRAEKVYNLIDGPMTGSEILRACVVKWNINISDRFKFAIVEKMLKSYIDYLHETGMTKVIIEEDLLKYVKVTD